MKTTLEQQGQTNVVIKVHRVARVRNDLVAKQRQQGQTKVKQWRFIQESRMQFASKAGVYTSEILNHSGFVPVGFEALKKRSSSPFLTPPSFLQDPSVSLWDDRKPSSDFSSRTLTILLSTTIYWVCINVSALKAMCSWYCGNMEK